MHPRPLSIRHLRPTLIVALAVLVAGLAAACGSDANDAGSLVLYSGRSESLVDPIIQEFADLTGIDVQVKYAGTASLAATLLEEGDKSPADVFYAQDPGGLGAVESMLAALPAETLWVIENLPNIELVNELSVRFETQTFKNEIRLCDVYDIQTDIVKKK